MIPVYNSANELIGLTMNSTTYSPEMLLTLIARLERAEADREQVRAAAAQGEEVIALLNEQVSDRESDLSYEYDARVYAEAVSDALRDLADGWAYHAHTCAANATTWQTASGRPDCTCGYDRAMQRVRDVPGPPLANTPLMRIVALGRAALAYAQARKSSAPLSSADGSAQAFRDTSIAYQVALAAAMEGDRP